MRYVFWFLKFCVFIVLFIFAMHNVQPVNLSFFLGYSWNAPLAMILLVFFVAGSAMGVLAALGKIVRLRREVVQLRKELRLKNSADMPVVSVQSDLTEEAI